MPIITETHSNSRCSIHNIEVILFLLLSLFATHPNWTPNDMKTNKHSSNPHSPVSLLRLCLNRSLPLHASNRLALSRSLEGYTAIIACQGKERNHQRIESPSIRETARRPRCPATVHKYWACQLRLSRDEDMGMTVYGGEYGVRTSGARNKEMERMIEEKEARKEVQTTFWLGWRVVGKEDTVCEADASNG